MTGEQEVKQALTNWLEEQPATAPGRLLANVLGDVGQTPQRGHWTAVMRSLPVFSQGAVRLYGVAAVVILAAVVAFAWWPRGQSIGPVGPSPTPSPAMTFSPTPSVVPTQDSTPTAAPSPTVGPSPAVSWVSWELSPPAFFINATLDMPDYRSPGNWGKTQIGTTFAVIYNDTGATYDTLNITTGAAPYVDPCAAASERTTVDVGPSVAALVRAMRDIKVNVSPTVDTEVAGYAAKQLTFTAPDARPGCENGEFQLWQWPDPFGERAPVGPIGKTTVYLIDVDGTRVMVTVEDRGTAADSALLQHMLDSLQFGAAGN